MEQPSQHIWNAFSEKDKLKDFFISYTSTDAEYAEWVAWQLEEVGYSTIIRAWDFLPGTNFVLEMNKASIVAKQTIAILSQEYLNALYTQPEWAAAFLQDPVGDLKTLLPVRVRSCTPQGLLSNIISIDLVGLDQEAACNKLLKGIKSVRQKPLNRPGFPEPSVEQDVTEYVLDSHIIKSQLDASVRLIDLSEIQPASPEKIQEYYRGVPLTWEIIAANGDVERVLYKKLIDTYSDIPNELLMLCFVGEPGAGKSTFAWRLAVDLAQITQRPLLQIRSREHDNNDIWFKLEAFYEKFDIPLVVLIDDVFRNHASLEALKTIRTDISILIISTSRSNEVPLSIRLPFKLEMLTLEAPTHSEKIRVLQKLDLNKIELSESSQTHLKDVNSWLAMMMEITIGHDFAKIVYDSMERLEKQSKVVFQAYEYLCFTGQVDLGIPETLLEQLDNEGHFYNLLEFSASQGLIFKEDNGTIRTQHPTIARQALAYYHRHPEVIAKRIFNVIQPEQDTHRLFLYNLLHLLVMDEQISFIKTLLSQQAQKINVILQLSGNWELYYQWAQLYAELGDDTKVRAIETIVLNKIPESTKDWLAFIHLTEHQEVPKLQPNLIEAISNWLKANLEDNQVRNAYLRLLQKKGTSQQVHILIEDTALWLASHPQDVSVYETFMKLVEQEGTPQQITDLIASTVIKLKPDYKQLRSLRPHYISLVHLKGNMEQINTALDLIALWMRSASAEDALYDICFQLIEKRGNSEQIQYFINYVMTLLTNFQSHRELRSSYLQFVERNGTGEQIAEAITIIGHWLSGYRYQTPVIDIYADIVKRCGTVEQNTQLADLYQSVSTRPCRNPNTRSHPRSKRNKYKRLKIEQLRSTTDLATEATAHNLPMNTETIDHQILDDKASMKDDDDRSNSIHGILETTENNLQIQAYLETTDSSTIPSLMQEVQSPQVLHHKKQSRSRSHPRSKRNKARKKSSDLIHDRDQNRNLSTEIQQTELHVAKQLQIPVILEKNLKLHNSDKKENLTQEEKWGQQQDISNRVKSAIEQLIAHPGEVDHYKDEIEYIVCYATIAQINPLMEAIASWISTHLTYISRKSYRLLINQYASLQQIYKLIDSASLWLASHPKDTLVRTNYLMLVERSGTDEMLTRASHEMKNWIADHITYEGSLRKQTFLIYYFGKILIKLKSYKEAEKLAQAYLKNGLNMHVILAWSLYYQNKKKDAYKSLCYVHQKISVGKYNYPMVAVLHYLGVYHRLEGNSQEAIQYLQAAISLNPNSYGNYWEIGRVFLEVQQGAQALEALETAYHLLPINIREKTRLELEEIIINLADDLNS